MKKLFVLTSSLLMSLVAQSQTITRTELLTDSVVVIPKTIAKWMLEDVEKMRSYEQELKTLYQVAETKQDVIDTQDQVIKALKNKNVSMSQSLSDYEALTGEQQIQINGLTADVGKQKKRKTIWKTLAFTAAAGILVNHLHWKYVKP